MIPFACLQAEILSLGACRKRKSARTADAVTLGDSWLGPAIKAGYLQPLQDVESYRWWVSLRMQPCCTTLPTSKNCSSPAAQPYQHPRTVPGLLYNLTNIQELFQAYSTTLPTSKNCSSSGSNRNCCWVSHVICIRACKQNHEY